MIPEYPHDEESVLITNCVECEAEYYSKDYSDNPDNLYYFLKQDIYIVYKHEYEIITGDKSICEILLFCSCSEILREWTFRERNFEKEWKKFRKFLIQKNSKCKFCNCQLTKKQKCCPQCGEVINEKTIEILNVSL